MSTQMPALTHRQDYRSPLFAIESCQLDIRFWEKHAEVISVLRVRRNAVDADSKSAPLFLDGQALTLKHIALDGHELSPDCYSLTDKGLTIVEVPDDFDLTITVTIEPSKNKALSGIYESRGIICSQCESEGFRRITYFLDRPDVLTCFRVRVEGDRQRYPYLLSNGNCVDQGNLPEGRHFTVWHDPHPKPCYLFACVAGDFDCLEDHYLTSEERCVRIRFFVEKGLGNQANHALVALKRAMAWDELHYGRCYDLDDYMVVAVDDFNFGAMENKGLNVFNTKCCLADPDVATDRDHVYVETVIAHEYFHNWTGNRVTLRDWFQLSLKEGLTVFRDQSFEGSCHDAAVKRIDDAQFMRNVQFVEDAGPMAHPVRPQSYAEINNFYTCTVYQKGAEVIRMLETLVGQVGFRRGTDLYFERHDGQAVCIEEWIAAMEDANGIDLSQFMRWYDQAGTPRVEVKYDYDSSAKTLVLHCEQSCPDTPGQSNKQPFVIPMRIALLDSQGALQHFQVASESAVEGKVDECVLMLNQTSQSFKLEGVSSSPAPSLFRGFSAPIEVELPQLDETAQWLLAAHDNDGFNRWQAWQNLWRHQVIQAHAGEGSQAIDEQLVQGVKCLLEDENVSGGLMVHCMTMPDLMTCLRFLPGTDVVALADTRVRLQRELGQALQSHWQSVVETYLACSNPYNLDDEAMQRRALVGLALKFYALSGDQSSAITMAKRYYSQADNLTDRWSALTAAMLTGHDGQTELVDDFYDRFAKRHDLVYGRWLMLQAANRLGDGLSRLQEIERSARYDRLNPNQIRSLWRGFVQDNPWQFHRLDGESYRYLVGRILEIDAQNPGMAARLCGLLSTLKYLDPQRQGKMREAIAQVDTASVSVGLAEVVTRIAES